MDSVPSELTFARSCHVPICRLDSALLTVVPFSAEGARKSAATAQTKVDLELVSVDDFFDELGR